MKYHKEIWKIDLNEHAECPRNDEFILEISGALSDSCGNGRGIELWIQ